jgi:choline-sulfatase
MESAGRRQRHQEWQTTPFGKFDGLRTLGGAGPNNDGRYVSGHNPSDRGQTAGVGGESVVEFLKNRARTLGKPFCLFISLVNPHDIGVYPGSWMKPSAWVQAGYRREDFAHLGIKLPDNYADDLSTKPKIQRRARDAYNKFAPLNGAQAREDYVNFYAYLHTVVDKHIMTVLDTLEETGLANDTIILRIADHGEGGLAHGMREKAYTVYEEMIHIPLIVHNPRLYPEPLETTASYDHLNLLPTILDLAGVPDASPTPSAKASSRSSGIRRRPCRITRSSRSMISASSLPAPRAVISVRSAKASGLMLCISASTAPASNTSFTISRMTRAK